MSVRQVIIAAPVSVISLLHLRGQGYQLYATCEGIKQPVQIRNIRPPRADNTEPGASMASANETPFATIRPLSQDNLIEICHWGYHWLPLTKVTRVVGYRVEPDQRTPWSESVTKSIVPGGHK